MAQEPARDGAADDHGDDRMAGQARLGERQLVGPGRLVHAENFLDLAGAVARGVHDQYQGTLALLRPVGIGGQGGIDGLSHLVGFLHADDPGVNDRELLVEGVRVVGNDRAGLAIKLRRSDNGPGTEFRVVEGLCTDLVFAKGTGIDDHVDRLAALANQGFRRVHGYLLKREWVSECRLQTPRRLT